MMPNPGVVLHAARNRWTRAELREANKAILAFAAALADALRDFVQAKADLIGEHGRSSPPNPK
jgi:hypothetical protein